MSDNLEKKMEDPLNPYKVTQAFGGEVTRVLMLKQKGDEENVSALDFTVIAALEKQMPKRPEKASGKGIRYTDTFRCPSCGGSFSGTGIAKFCYHCGQALWWMEDSEIMKEVETKKDDGRVRCTECGKDITDEVEEGIIRMHLSTGPEGCYLICAECCAAEGSYPGSGPEVHEITEEIRNASETDEDAGENAPGGKGDQISEDTV